MPDSIRGNFAHDTSPKWLGIFLVARHDWCRHGIQLTQWPTATVTIPSPSHHKIMVDRLNHPQSWYPLVNVYITMERSTMLLMGKSTISMAIFNSKLLVYQRVVHGVAAKHRAPGAPKLFGKTVRRHRSTSPITTLYHPVPANRAKMVPEKRGQSLHPK